MGKKFPKRIWNKMVKSAREHSETKRDFDRTVEEVFGCHYSDFDDDQIIDVCDYGTGWMSYAEFVARMKRHQADEDVD